VAALAAGIRLATDDDEPSGGGDVTQSAADADPQALADERLTEQVRDRGEGISARIPESWKQSSEQGLISLESGDRCVAISLAAPVGKSSAGSLLDDTVAELRGEFEGAQVQRLGAQRIGGLPGETVVLQVKPAKGDQVRVLITVGRGKQQAYLTQVVLRDPACGDALVDSQLVVNSIEYTK
jgi:hypothetical protein